LEFELTQVGKSFAQIVH